MDSTLGADEYYKKGLELKASGLHDRALTEFRRAVLADANHGPAHFEIGLLTKSKGDKEPYFLRYAFDAFRNATRLDVNNQQAHDQYIMVGQKMGRLDELHSEYDALAKAHPENPLFERCAKNIVTLSLALIPENINIGTSANTGGIRKILLFASIGLILFGVALALGPGIYGKLSKTPMTPEMAKRCLWLGFIAMGGGIGGFFFRGRF